MSLVAITDDQRSFDQMVGRNLQSLRTAAGMSQGQLAEALTDHGISFQQQTVLKVEKGDRPLRLREAEALASILHVEIASLVATPDLEVIRTGRTLERDLQRLGIALEMVASTKRSLLSQIERRASTTEEPLPGWVEELACLTLNSAIQKAVETWPEDVRQLMGLDDLDA